MPAVINKSITKMQWNESLATGHQLIDTTHRFILSRLEGILQKSQHSSEISEDEIKKDFSYIFSIISFHIETEEAILNEILNQKEILEQHKIHHVIIMEKFATFERELLEGEILIFFTILYKLAEEFLEHLKFEVPLIRSYLQTA
jgi:hemerythrin